MAAAFVSMALIARVYGSEVFGLLNLALAIVALLTPLIHMGLNAIVTRDLVRSPDDRERIISTIIFMRTSNAVVCFLVAALVLAFLDLPSKLGGYILMILAAEMFRGGLIFSYFLEARNKNKIIAVTQVSTVLLVSLLRALAAINHVDFAWIVASYLFEACLFSLLMAGYFRICHIKLRIALSMSMTKTYLRNGMPLIASGLTAVIYQKVDQVMIGKMIDVEAVGIYAVASKISEVWYFMPTMIMTAAFPTLLAKKKSSQQEYEAFMEGMFCLLAMLGYGAVLAATLFAPWFVPLVFGQEYAASVAVLVIHIWGGIFISMRALASKWILVEDVLRYSLITQGLGALFNVCLNLVLIPRYGIMGAAIATLASYSVASLWSFGLLPRSRGIFFMMLRSLLLYRAITIVGNKLLAGSGKS